MRSGSSRSLHRRFAHFFFVQHAGEFSGPMSPSLFLADDYYSDPAEFAGSSTVTHRVSRSASLCIATIIVFVHGCEPPGNADSAKKTEKWSAAPSMHHARAAHAFVATSDAIYALPGT